MRLIPAVLAVATVSAIQHAAGAGQGDQSKAAPASAAERQAVVTTLHDLLPEDVLAAILPDGMIGIDDDDLGEVIKTPTPVIIRGATLRGVPVKRLPAVDVPALLAEDAQMAQFSKALRFGVGRNLLAEMRDGSWAWLGADADNDQQLLAVNAQREAGWLWVMDIQSDGAVAMRVRALNMMLPEGATLIAYDPASPQSTLVGPYDDRGPFDDGEVWMPTIVSQRVRVECWAPASGLTGAARAGIAPPQQPLFFLDRIQHVYRDPLLDDFQKNGGGGGDDEGSIAGSGCHNQIACHPEWLDLAKAVGGIGSLGENSVWCTGTLIRTQADDKTPYFLTAHHCLSLNFEARDAEVYWQYQAATCGGAAPGLQTVEHSNVCSMVSTGAGSDYTLLMIEGPVAPNSTFASWTSVDAPDGTNVVCIHHPLGKQKRISFGTKAGNPTCGGALTHIRSNWNDGVTQPGSSGSGLFRADTGELIGQLHCGSSDCGQVTNDSYGAFFNTHLLIADHLDAGEDDAFEPNRTCGTASVITPGAYPNLVVKSTDADWYRINVPNGKKLTIKANFKNIWGDIDLRLYNGCGTTPVSSSTTTANVETVSYTNTTGSTKTLRVRVYLFNDVRATYKLTVTLGNP